MPLVPIGSTESMPSSTIVNEELELMQKLDEIKDAKEHEVSSVTGRPQHQGEQELPLYKKEPTLKIRLADNAAAKVIQKD